MTLEYNWQKLDALFTDFSHNALLARRMINSQHPPIGRLQNFEHFIGEQSSMMERHLQNARRAATMRKFEESRSFLATVVHICEEIAEFLRDRGTVGPPIPAFDELRGITVRLQVFTDAMARELHTSALSSLVFSDFNFDWSIKPPEQEIAVAQFTIEDDMLKILHRTLIADDIEDAIYVQEARDALLDRAKDMEHQLEGSNAAFAVLPPLRRIINWIGAGRGPVGLSIAVAEFDAVRSALDTLSDVHASILDSFSKALWDFINQFPEWHRYQERARAENLSGIDTQELAEAAERWSDEMERSGAATKEVPDLIRHLGRMAVKVGSRARYALVKTVENILKVLVGEMSKWLRGISDASLSALTSTIRMAGPIVLLSGFLLFADSVAALPDGAWIKDVAAKARPVLEEMLKMGSSAVK